MSDPVVLPPWAAGMRQEVRRVVAGAGGRRRLPLRCWVGHPGGIVDESCVALPHPVLDRGLPEIRAELVERALDALEHHDDALAWLTRSGQLGAGDEELAWWSAVRRGFARHGAAPAGFCVVNRTGWLDLASGAGRSWSRVRAGSRPG